MPDPTNDIDALLDALLPSASGFGNCEMHRTDALRYRAALTALVAERDQLKDELERERMRLAACGVAAMSNTRETAKLNRQVHDEYRSASLDDVCAAVDREMALRERVAVGEMQLRAERDEARRMLCEEWAKDGLPFDWKGRRGPEGMADLVKWDCFTEKEGGGA